MSHRLLTSIQVRVTAIATAAVVVVLVLAGLTLVEAQRRQLVDHVDETIEMRAAELTVEAREGGTPRLLAARGADTVVQIVAPDGVVLSSSPALAGEAALARAGSEPGPRTIRGVPLETGDYRLVARTVETDDGPAVLLVAGSLDDVAESTSALRRSLLIGIPALAVVLALILWFVVGRLLERVQRATRAQQRFVADAAHELRTPLARMRTELEVDLAHPETADPRVTPRSLLEETVALQALTDDLLLLARYDAGEPVRSREPVDVDALVLEECHAAVVPEHVTLDTTGVGVGRTRGDANRLARAFRNPLENALRHASTIVRVTVGEVNGTVRVTVVDDGPGLAAADRDRMFDRFARLDEARSATGGGTGLGLAITKEIAEQHGGHVLADEADDGGTALSITLPAVR